MNTCRTGLSSLRSRRLALLLLLAALPFSALACEGEVQARYRSQPPLLATMPDSALQVSLHAGGCVRAHFPRQDVRAGVREWQLPKARWEGLRAEIAASGVADLDGAALKQRVQQAQALRAKSLGGDGGGVPLYLTSDENLIEFVLPDPAGGKRQRGLSWTALHADQLNLPGDPDLARIAALQALFLELAAETHAKGVQR